MKISIAVAAAAALLATLTPVASSGGTTPQTGVRATACGGSVWPGTAVGKPAALAASGLSSVYVWVGRGAWHVRVKGSPSTPLTGQLSANARLKNVNATAGVRSTLSATGKRITFTVGSATGVEGIDLNASCATRLSFAFGAMTRGGTAAPQPQVFLGAKGQAPARAFDLARPAATGVSGQIVVGPTCPIVGMPGCTPAKHIQGTVRIEKVSATRGGGSPQVVARVASDANGRFSAGLAPGHYMLVLEASSDNYPRARPSLVDVEAGVVSDVVVVLDTGIR